MNPSFNNIVMNAKTGRYTPKLKFSRISFYFLFCCLHVSYNWSVLIDAYIVPLLHKWICCEWLHIRSYDIWMTITFYCCNWTTYFYIIIIFSSPKSTISSCSTGFVIVVMFLDIFWNKSLQLCIWGIGVVFISRQACTKCVTMI